MKLVRQSSAALWATSGPCRRPPIPQIMSCYNAQTDLDLVLLRANDLPASASQVLGLMV